MQRLTDSECETLYKRLEYFPNSQREQFCELVDKYNTLQYTPITSYSDIQKLIDKLIDSDTEKKRKEKIWNDKSPVQKAHSKMNFAAVMKERVERTIEKNFEDPFSGKAYFQEAQEIISTLSENEKDELWKLQEMNRGVTSYYKLISMHTYNEYKQHHNKIFNPVLKELLSLPEIKNSEGCEIFCGGTDWKKARDRFTQTNYPIVI